MSTRRGAEEANRESHETSQSHALQEVKDRLRRMETRLVTLCTNLGYETVRKKPKWRINDEGPEVEIPSMETSIKDILEVIPVSHERMLNIVVTHKGKRVCWIEQT